VKTFFSGMCALLFCLPAFAQAPQESKNLVISNNNAAQEALAGDDYEKARTALQALAKGSEGDLKTLSETAANAGNIKLMRLAFKPLSQAVIKLEIPEGLVVASCPMVPASWVQKDGEIRNPYYGRSMLTCGTINKKKR
jgi:hypothetical protein